MLKKFTAAVIMVLMACAASVADDLDRVREAQLDGDFKGAESILRNAISSKPANAGLYLYLLGSNLAAQDRCGDAIAVFDRLIKEHSNSDWADKADFRKADCLIALGNFRDAEEIYDRQTSRILSSERKMEIAAIYIKYADGYYTPDDDTEPDYARAVTFYKKALTLNLPEEKEFQVRMKLALCYHNLANYSEAFIELNALLEREYLPEEIEKKAMYYIGLSRLNEGLNTQARKRFEDLLEKHPTDGNAPEAAYLLGKTHGLPYPGSMMQLELGVAAHKNFIEKFSTHGKAPAAALEIAQSYYNMGRYEEAIEQLKIVIGMFGDRPDVDEAPLAKILLGQCYFEQEKYAEAISQWKKYAEEHPTHHQWRETSGMIISAEFSIAEKAASDEKYDVARAAFSRFLVDHPLDELARDAMFELGHIEFRTGAFNDAIKVWKKLVSKYPDSDQASRAQFMISQIFENEFDDQEAALAAYEEVQGSYYSQARARIEEMRSSELVVLSERSFTTGEKPMLKLTLRNIEALKAKAYKIDIETYFKKYHDFRGIENLDIALIDPDFTWDFPVADYRKLKTFEVEMKVPVDSAGVYAITVGNDELEATTVLLVSDIAAIVKSSSASTFVFVEDMRNGTPAAGVNILLSNGSTIFEAGKTGADGVLHYKELKSGSNVSVLAIKGGSIASNKLNIGNISRSTSGNMTKGIIYTDRPAYRPGQEVSVKGIVRDIIDGSYTFNPGDEYGIRIMSPGGAVLHSEAVKLSDFGTFQLTCKTDPGAMPGKYTIEAVRGGKSVFSSSFKVDEYKLQRIKLTVEPAQEIYRRGDEIKAKVKTSYYFGEPAAGKSVGYRISYGGRILNYDGVTGENGELEISFEGIEDYEENTLIMIYAYMKDENVSASANVWITVTEFALSVGTLRDVYLAGESVGVEVRAADVKGAPADAKVKLEVLRRVNESGTTSEVRMMEEDMAVASKGISRATVKLSEGGYYVLRAFSRDKFNNPITAEKVIFISGDEDSNRLRIMAERDEFRVGESPSLKVIYREEPALALITFEGESIYRYKLITLKKGENVIKIDITDELAPNFTLGIAVMKDNRFHSADKDFLAVKGLVITLEPEGEVFAPGGRMKLKVKTTDSNGVPVRAELSLALVDESLYSLFADDVPPLGEFFFGGKRGGRYNTISTNTFSYAGLTRTVLKEILAEESRLDMAKAQPVPSSVSIKRAKSGGIVSKEEEGAGRGDYAEEMDMTDDYLSANSAPPSPSHMMAGALLEAPVESKHDLKDENMLMETVARLREFFPETGYWNPAVDTGANGETDLEITLPDTATSWRLTSRGATVNTLVGEKTAAIITRQEFFITVKSPSLLVQGGEAGFLVEAHNLTGKILTAEIDSSMTSGNNTRSLSSKLEIPANSNSTVLLRFDVPSGNSKSAELSITARAGEFADRLQMEIPVRKFAVEVSASKSGTSSEDSTAYVSFPDNVVASDPEMSVIVSPSILSSVMDVQFPGQWLNYSTSLEMISILYRLEYLKKTGADTGAYAALTSRLQSLVMRLTSNIEDDGSISWSAKSASRRTPNITVACNSVWALTMARDLGIDFDRSKLDKAADALLDRFSNTDSSEYKVEILHALSYLDKADFAYLNRLDRERSGLSTRALAFMALSYANLGRAELAADVAVAIEQRTKDKDIPAILYEEIARIGLPTRDSSADAALALLAILRSRPSSPASATLMNTVESARRGSNWGCPDTTAFAVAALSTFYSATAFSGDRYTLEVIVNDHPVKTINSNASHPSVRIPIPAEFISMNKENKVSFKMNGRGSYTYSAVLTGFTSYTSYTNPEGYDKVYVYSDDYVMSPPSFKGIVYAPGSGVLSKHKSYADNFTDEVPTSDYVTYKFSISDNVDGAFTDNLVIEKYLPAGATVEKESVSGSFEYYELRDGKIVFYCTGVCNASFRMFGYLPGKYMTLPLAIYPASEPWKKYYYLKNNSFKVLAPGEERTMEYELSPDQLYNLGRAFYDEKIYDDAEVLLSRLIAGYQLNDNPFRETHRMLMQICIDSDDSRCIVEHFEVLKEKYPTLSMDIEDILRVARAYRDIEEFERAIQVYVTALESSFMTDGEARIFLENEGRFLDSLDYLAGLARGYPDLNVVQNAVYSNAHILYSKKDSANSLTDVIERGLQRNDILAMAVDAFEDYMLLYPLSAYIDEAGFSMASVLFDMVLNSDLISETRKLQKRFPKSPFLDSYEYLEAYGHFESGAYDRALALCKKIAEGQYYNSSGALVESDSKNLALYISAQIYHAMNKPDKAFEYYGLVRSQFKDADGAYSYFDKKTFSIPEITSVRSGTQASVTLTHRNVKDVEIKVYRVDLMKFYLLRKSLKGMSEIRLSGVKPIYEKTVSLAGAQEYRDRETALNIPLSRDGAYLVELRGGNMYASSMLLRTNMELEVQEDASSGRVRVNVLDTRTGRYVHKAHVKIVGSNDGRIRSGDTDLRGIFTADGVSGSAAVLVRKDDQFAFHSGTTQLMAGGGLYKDIPADSRIDSEAMRSKNTANIGNENEMIQMRNANFLQYNMAVQQGIQIQQIENNAGYIEQNIPQQMYIPNIDVQQVEPMINQEAPRRR